MSVNQNNAKVIEACTQRITALNKHVTATKATMTVNGKPMKLADLIAAYQDAIDTRATLVEQRAAFDKALAARDSADVTRLAIDQGLKAWVTTQFGAGSNQAKEFGFLPRKVMAASAETKALAVKKLRATRKARGTRGKRQKAQIKGTVDVSTAPAAPAITTTAAPPAAAVPASTNGAPNGASPASNGATTHSA